jgi:rRNA-processing protein FCF1
VIIIDTNALVILLIGLIDPGLFKTHKRTSIYEAEDYNDLVDVIGDVKKLIVLPNVWTETDNLLNDFGGNYKHPYIVNITQLINLTYEKFFDSSTGAQSDYFFELGLTDSLILECARECELLITSDSKLSDYATANNIKVYDMVRMRNDRL